MPDLEALLDTHAGTLVADGTVRPLAGAITGDSGDAARFYGGATPDTVFEIGSITKTFTGTLLALLVLDGTVALDDPIGVHLPCAAPPVTLLDLATHTSGLPRLPPNLEPIPDLADPYAHYTVELLYESLASVELRTTPGAAGGADTEYSNYGFALLGHVLGIAADSTYEALVAERVCVPLGMTSTSFDLEPVQGHDEADRAVPAWTNQPTLGGAGGLRSTIADMAVWLQAQCSPFDSPLTDAVVMATTAQRGGIGLGWHLGGGLIWHNGGTAGFSSLLGWHEATGSGVVLLASSYLPRALDEAGLHIIKEITGG